MIKHPSDAQAQADLMELYADREQLLDRLKFAPADRVAEGQALLRDIDKKIDECENAEANVQEQAAKLDAAMQARRIQCIEMLKSLDLVEKEPTTPQEALNMIPNLRAETLALLKQDAEERGIPNDDH